MNTSKSEIAPVSQAKLLFERIAPILDKAQQKVLRAVNSEIVLAYWLIGREIVTVLQSGVERAAYGKAVIAELSQSLGQRYGKGYSSTNLWYFRQFYLSYANVGNSEQLSAPTNEVAILHPLGGELTPSFHPNLSWSHYRSLMRIEKLAARQFYENEAVRANWSKRDLAACRRQGSSAAKSPERAIFHGLFGQYLDIDTANPAKSVLVQPIFRNDALSPTGC